MIPLWMRAGASTPPQCGWALSSVRPPCVAQRVWPMPVVDSGSGSASISPKVGELPRLLARLDVVAVDEGDTLQVGSPGTRVAPVPP